MTHDPRSVHIDTPPEHDLSSGPIPGFSGGLSPRSSGGALRFSRYRPGYSRLDSHDTRATVETAGEERAPEGHDGDKSGDAATQGLGRGGVGDAGLSQSQEMDRRASTHSIPRKSIGNVVKTTTITLPQWSPTGLESPKSAKASIQALSPPAISPQSAEHRLQAPFDTIEVARGSDAHHRSQNSLQSSLYSRANTVDFQDSDPLKPNAGAPSFRSARSGFDNDFDPRDGCPAAVNFEHSRLNWFGISMFALSVFSTVFSGIYFVIAAKGPRYGHYVGTNGRLSSSTASILTTLFAKLIELSFVTVFVAFVGQALSRRAFMARERGVSLAELSMRTWIMQPGSLITNYETLRYAALTVLGACCLSAALVALLYTTAADALGKLLVCSACPTRR